MNGDRRSDLPPRARERERKLREALRLLQEMFPGQGLGLFVFDFGEGGDLSWISNARREDTRRMLIEYLERSEAGTDDTLGRGEA